MKGNLSVRASDNQSHGPIAKPHSPDVAARACTRHITQLKCAVRLGGSSPDDAVMAARHVLAREKAAGIQCVIAKGCRFSFLKHPKNYIRDHLQCRVTEGTGVHRHKTRAIVRLHS